MKKKFLAAAIASGALVISSTPAHAVEVERSGSCSAGSIWQADFELEYRVFDLGFEIDTKNADETWTFTLKHNGKRVVNDSRVAFKEFDDSYAEVEWDMVRPDRQGNDRFHFRAVNKTSGEICKVTLRA